MKKIWRGVTWSIFIRRWLGRSRTAGGILHVAAIIRWKFIPNKAWDEPSSDERVAGKPKNLIKLPKKTSNLKKAIALGWEIIKQSKNACSAFGRIMMSEVTNTISHQELIELDPELQWAYQEATGGSRASGDRIQNAFQQYHLHPQGFPDTDFERLDGYTVHELKILLAQGILIGTGCYWKWVPEERATNFGLMKKTGEFVPGTGKSLGGHFIVLVDFDATGFICIESEKMQWGDNMAGVFHVAFEHAGSLMSKYISKDCKDFSEDDGIKEV